MLDLFVNGMEKGVRAMSEVLAALFSVTAGWKLLMMTLLLPMTAVLSAFSGLKA